MKALFGLWQEMKVADINRILKPHGVKLVSKGSKAWGKQVTVTAHPIGAAAKRSRLPATTVKGVHPAKEDANRMAAGFGAALDQTKAAVGVGPAAPIATDNAKGARTPGGAIHTADDGPGGPLG